MSSASLDSGVPGAVWLALSTSMSSTRTARFWHMKAGLTWIADGDRELSRVFCQGE